MKILGAARRGIEEGVDEADAGIDQPAERRRRRRPRQRGRKIPTRIRERKNIVTQTISHAVNPVIHCVDP